MKKDFLRLKSQLGKKNKQLDQYQKPVRITKQEYHKSASKIEQLKRQQQHQQQRVKQQLQQPQSQQRQPKRKNIQNDILER